MSTDAMGELIVLAKRVLSDARSAEELLADPRFRELLRLSPERALAVFQIATAELSDQRAGAGEAESEARTISSSITAPKPSTSRA